MIRIKRKSSKILGFSSRQSVVVVPSNTDQSDITLNFVIDPVAALKSGAENVDFSIVRNKFSRPSVVDGYSKNGDIASKVQNFSKANSEANDEYNRKTILLSSFSVQSVIQNNLPELLEVDLNDSRALNQSFPKTDVLLTKKSVSPRDTKSAIEILGSPDFVFSGQEQLFNSNNSRSSLHPNSSRLSEISQNDASLAAGVFIANCAKLPFPIQQTQRDHRDLKVSQYGELSIGQSLDFLGTVAGQVRNTTVVLNADKSKADLPTKEISVNSFDFGTDVDVYNEFSGVSATAEKLFLVSKRIRRIEFGVTAGIINPAGVNNFTVIATVRNSNGVALQRIEKEVDATKMINSVITPLSRPSLFAVSGKTDESGNFKISCIVERKDFFNSRIAILAKEPGGKFENISNLSLNLNEPFEFNLIPEASAGFLRVRAIALAPNSQTSQEFSEIAVKIGEGFEILESPVGSQSFSGRPRSFDIKSSVRSSEDGRYDVRLSALLSAATGGRILPPLFDKLVMRRINLANGERPEDPTSGTTVFETGTTFTGQFGGSVRGSEFSDRVDAGSYVYVFDGMNTENGFEQHGITSIPVTIPEGFISEPGGRKSGSDGTLIRASAAANLESEKLVGSISINPETTNIEILQSEIGLVIQGSDDFSKQAEIKIESYITAIEGKDDGTLEIGFSIPGDDIPEDVKDDTGRLISSTASASFQYETRTLDDSGITEGVASAQVVSSFEVGK
jgi:hypothetical protein